MADVELDLEQIQGNVLAGFNKDHQAFLFLQFTEAPRARAWLGQIAKEVVTTTEVNAYNHVFKLVHHRRGHASNEHGRGGEADERSGAALRHHHQRPHPSALAQFQVRFAGYRPSRHECTLGFGAVTAGALRR